MASLLFMYKFNKTAFHKHEGFMPTQQDLNMQAPVVLCTIHKINAIDNGNYSKVITMIID